MKIMLQEAEGQDLDREFGFCRGDQVQKAAVVLSSVKDGRAAIAAAEDMVGAAADLSTGNARHHL